MTTRKGIETPGGCTVEEMTYKAARLLMDDANLDEVTFEHGGRACTVRRSCILFLCMIENDVNRNEEPYSFSLHQLETL